MMEERHGGLAGLGGHDFSTSTITDDGGMGLVFSGDGASTSGQGSNNRRGSLASSTSSLFFEAGTGELVRTTQSLEGGSGSQRRNSDCSSSGFPGRSLYSAMVDAGPVPVAISRLSIVGTCVGGDPQKLDHSSSTQQRHHKQQQEQRHYQQQQQQHQQPAAARNKRARRGSGGSESFSRPLARIFKSTFISDSIPFDESDDENDSTYGWRLERGRSSRIFDEPDVVAAYESIPVIEIDQLPRGGLSFETHAVGRVQFGIPPETIKDSMRLGLSVPRVYIVPVERFCREMGPALGINVAEFEFPAYFSYFVQQKRCTLVVDSTDAEHDIRRVFGETLLGPAQFRNYDAPKPNNDEDFDHRHPVEARPNFFKESQYFRRQEATEQFDELCLEMLIDFCHFKSSAAQRQRRSSTASSSPQGKKLGVPPIPLPLPPKSSVAEVMNESETSLHTPTKERFGNETIPKQVSGVTRRHTTKLDVIESESKGDNNLSNERSNFANAKTPRRASITCIGRSCKGCFQCEQLKKQNITGAAEKSVENEPFPMRRARSDPDLRKRAKDDQTFTTASDFNPNNLDNASTMGDGGGAMSKRRSMDTLVSTNITTREPQWTSGASFVIESEDEDDRSRSWMYSRTKWLGDVATIYPHTATAEQRAQNMTARVEIFKMAGGTEYIVHDIDENNHIVGKVRFSGSVRVPDEFAVQGFLSSTGNDDVAAAPEIDFNGSLGGIFQNKEQAPPQISIPLSVVPPTFHPPSFGVTVLGNSHGFDKNGSTSGYVLWINGRGVMIDPPPYSSATLEREGIRPQMIMAIIITHCHADHDAGAFQKLMTGSQLAVITTPTIYKSFIRKYAALSGLSPALLRHSHRHRPAIVGQPLRFQGATFHFNYTLHTIPCIAFKVEWRGKSMIFTGDHMNIPSTIDRLQKQGVLTKERADDLRRFPLEDCDLLLHESGAPPIHTPIEVLLELPQEVKDRLYVVHTSALPDSCGLHVAPIGTANTFRLDSLDPLPHAELVGDSFGFEFASKLNVQSTNHERHETSSNGIMNGSYNKNKSVGNQADQNKMRDSKGENAIPPLLSLTGMRNTSTRSLKEEKKVPPLLMLRPTDVSDAWFILNLLSNVPFLSSLSYANTMEVLEIAQVEVFCQGEIVIPAHRRKDFLCVVWEGTCIESNDAEGHLDQMSDALSHATEFHESILTDGYLAVDGDVSRHESFSVWHAGDWTGPESLQPVCSLSGECTHRGEIKDIVALSAQGVKVIMVIINDLHKILKSGSSLYRKYLEIQEEQAVMKSRKLAIQNEMVENVWSERPSHSRLPAFDMTYNLLEILNMNSALGRLTALQKRHLESLGEGPRCFGHGEPIWVVGQPVDYAFLIISGTTLFSTKPIRRKKALSRRGSTGNMSTYFSLKQGLSRLGVYSPQVVKDKLISVSQNSEYRKLEKGLQHRADEMETGTYDDPSDLLPEEERARNARDRFANKVLARLYSRQAFTGGLIFSRGHFLSDTSRMVSGSLAFIHGKVALDNLDDAVYSKGEHHFHSSTIVAGRDGCVVMIFPKERLISFFDAHPGVLLSVLGTQVVV